MSSISAVPTSVPPYAPPASPKGGKQDGDHDHGVEPVTTAAPQPSSGNPGSSGAVNLTA